MSHSLHIRPARNCAHQPSPTRNRVLYAGLALAVITAGLLWRSGFIPLLPVVSKYGGERRLDGHRQNDCLKFQGIHHFRGRIGSHVIELAHPKNVQEVSEGKNMD